MAKHSSILPVDSRWNSGAAGPCRCNRLQLGRNPQMRGHRRSAANFCPVVGDHRLIANSRLRHHPATVRSRLLISALLARLFLEAIALDLVAVDLVC